jgi:two-component system, OmpR family, sensor histidine kinase BaeS
VTGDRRRGLGPLGRRLLVAFLLVALSSVAVLAAAALVGADRGLAAARQAEREHAASGAAAAAAAAYTAASGWAAADLDPAAAVAQAAGARLVVWDVAGRRIGPTSGADRGNATGGGVGGQSGTGGGPPGGAGAGDSAETGVLTSPVRVGATTVGWVRLAFGSPAATGRGIAWSWILLAAAAAAAAAAVTASWFVTRLLTRSLVRLAGTARALAAGHRPTIAAPVTAPGELGELAVALDRMAADLARAERTRRQLTADVAHELRTPLAGLQAGLEELRDGLAEPDVARLAALHDQTLRLGRIVDDLAELAAAESAALSLHPADVDLSAAAAGALAAHRAQLVASGLQIRTDLQPGLAVHADPDRLHQALGNLLANAARHCRPGDTVTVQTRHHNSHAVAEVADTGPGIPATDLPHVFDRLWRGSSHRGSGSGIGLAVVRELVTAHGGTVTATSEPGHGMTFTISLPTA